jgi:hypothetical protein
MWLAVVKTVVAAILISFVSWLAGKKTGIAGFLTALPITTLIALAFSHLEWGDSKQSVDYAKSILVAIPISLLFFIPFLVAHRFSLGFWSCYGGGIALLGIGFVIHSYTIKLL